MALRKNKKEVNKMAPKRKAGSNRTSTSKSAKTPQKNKPAKKAKTDVNVLSHGLNVQAGALPDSLSEMISHGVSLETGLTKSQDSMPKAGLVTTPETVVASVTAGIASVDEADQPKKKRTAKPKDRLGTSPYPEFARPTPEECYELNEILTKAHGEVRAPENIPVPSKTVAGCGQVKFVLEALIRTHLSAHTSMDNANKAIRGLIKRYPTLKDGPCAGSIDWNNIRLARREKLEKAIKQGGMAPKKSRFIKAILDQVYEENETRRHELKEKAVQSADAEKDEIDTIEISQDLLNRDSKAAIMARFADQILLEHPNILTLDHVHAMHPSDAFEKLRSYNGIGDKTAACVLLFCMQRPFFAVDTHVWRLCRWLGWAPPTADRNKTFYHCDVKVPDDLKYSLHQLMIAHGKDCGRCRANTSEKSEAWAEGCPIEELVKRIGERKGGEDLPKPKSRKRKVEAGKKKTTKGSGTSIKDSKSEKVVKKVKDSEKATAKKEEEKTKAATRSKKRKAATQAEHPNADDSDDPDFEPKPKKVRSIRKIVALKNNDDGDSDFTPTAKKARITPKKAAPKKKPTSQTKINLRETKVVTRSRKSKVQPAAATVTTPTPRPQDIQDHHSPSSQESISALAEAMVASEQDDDAKEQFTPPTEHSD